MAAILNSAMLDSDTAILESNTLLSSLRFTQKPSSSTLTLTQTHSFSLNLMMAVILNLAILDSAMLVFPLKVTDTFQDWFPYLHKKNFTHSFWLNLIMADSFILTQLDNGSHLASAILDSDTAILNSYTLLSSLRFTQKQSPCTLTLTQTNSIWLTIWWQTSLILPSWIQPCCTKLWLNLIKSDSNSFILTQFDMGSHLEFCHVGLRHCHLGFRHLVIFTQIHSKTLFPPLWLWLKLIPSD